jgi:carbonic anhydrase/acetyltransferase-like protein (isoleucine patch superfamily)
LLRILNWSLGFNLLFISLLLVGYVGPNIRTTFVPEIAAPEISAHAYVHPLASVIGSVTIGERVFVAPAASIRGDEGQHIHIGHDSNVQDGVVVHGLETFEGGHAVPEHEVEAGGRKYSVYVGHRVSLAHQSQVHGPAKVGDDTFVGMQALIFKTELGDHVVVEPGAKLIGVKVAPGRYVPALSLITKQAQADALPRITPDYPYRTMNDHVVKVNVQLAQATMPKALFSNTPIVR